MTVKCEAMVDASSLPQDPESKQALVVDDSSAKTIEFLRARLLAERAASKAARQEAQEVAEKVNDLHVRLETEIEHRKEAEAAMERVFAILKAKGLPVDGLVLASADLKDQSESRVSLLSDVKETSEDHESTPCHIVEPSINKEVPHMPLENKDESTDKGMVEMVETRIQVTNESHSSNVEVVNTVETCHATQEAFPCNARALDVPLIDRTGSGKDFFLRNAEGHHCQVDDDSVQRTIINKQVVHTDNITPNCSPECKKDPQTARTIEQGLSITLKLKAMLHQIEEEVCALPKEQPLKYQLQGWMHQVASVLDKGEEPAGINGGLEIHGLDDSNKASANYPLKGATDLETKSIIHTKMPILLTKKGHADAVHLHETAIHSDGMTEEGDTKEELDKSLSIVPKDMLQHPNLLPSSNNYHNGEYPTTMYPPTCVDPVWHANMSQNRNPSCELLNGSNRAAYVLQDPPRRPLHPQMMQHVISQTSIANPPMFANGHTSNGHYVGSESSYLVEAQSPKSSDVISVGDAAGKVGYAHGQWNEAWYQGRVLGSKRQAGYREDALKFQSEAWSQDGYFNHGNIQYERGPAISHSTFMHARDAREFNMKSTARHPSGRPLSDATLSLVDDRNGRLGDILMALDAARLHVNDDDQSLYAEQCIGPPNRGYRQYGDKVQQAPCEYRNHAWRSRARSQAPIIHFPPSPTSEHGYSPFERHGGHRRSSSVATNFMMSEWESYPQPRGEVQLGNGITLYTD